MIIESDEEIFDMPCTCSCGAVFDLNDGNTCAGCNIVFCENCVDEPFGLCAGCAE